MSKHDDNVRKIALDAIDKYIKIVCYLIFVNYAFDFIITLPPDIANKIFNAIFKKLGL
jgi:D-alanyl-lipoteichoic acid acyltransferase DltB (MBOAT superfamily)